MCRNIHTYIPATADLKNPQQLYSLPSLASLQDLLRSNLVLKFVPGGIVVAAPEGVPVAASQSSPLPAAPQPQHRDADDDRPWTRRDAMPDPDRDARGAAAAAARPRPSIDGDPSPPLPMPSAMGPPFAPPLRDPFFAGVCVHVCMWVWASRDHQGCGAPCS